MSHSTIEPNICTNQLNTTYKDASRSIEERIECLIGQMKIDEKIAQMMCLWEFKTDYMLDEERNLDFSKIEENLSNGVGHIARLSDTGGGLNSLGSGESPTAMVERANAIQKFFLEKTRLGIPVIFHEECLHGLAATNATSYPQPIGLAATFNPDLVEKIFRKIAKDVRMRGAHQALTPVLDVCRDPRWGRVEETFGEDPYLIAKIGSAAVNGLQGDKDFTNKNNILSTLKHFAAHGQPESGTNCGPANYSERVIRDVFLAPFKEVIKKSAPASVMPSYNEIDGVPSHANQWLLKEILINEWNFNGFIVSDYFAITELFEKEDTTGHKVVKDLKEAALKAVKAGVNMELPDPKCYVFIRELFDDGEISEDEIDSLIYPILEYKFRLGIFEDPYVYTTQEEFDQKLVEDRDLAKEIALETITLLKNKDNILPLSTDKYKKIAVIGPNADRILLGGYSGEPVYNTTVYEGLNKKYGSDVEFTYSEGCNITIGGKWTEDEIVFPTLEDDLKLIRAAEKVALESDLVILCVGGNEQTSREAWAVNHLGDRSSLELFGNQQLLVDKIVATGKKVVTLLFNGRPLSIENLYNEVDALLECWYLGQENGNAVAEILFGKVSPSGKLPISFPRSVGHIPCFYNSKPSAKRGYVDSDVSSLFAFGFGLSYSEFELSNLIISSPKIDMNGSTKVSIDIENIGHYSGHETIQLYFRDMVSSVTRPVKELKRFKKIFLNPKEKTTIEFTLSAEDFAFTDIDFNFRTEPGEFKIMIGNSSRDEDLISSYLEIVKTPRHK